MQSENFDKKIKDSLSQRPPGNDNPAWDKMETLLDKHMPVEKKDRRRIFFILFLFLLLGGGGFLIWKNNGGKDHNISQAKPNSENSTQNNSSTNSPLEKEKSSNTPGTTSTETSSSQESDQATSKDFVKIPNPNNSTPLAGHEIEIDASGKIIGQKPQNGSGTKKTTVEKDKPVNQTKDALIKDDKPGNPSLDKPSNASDLVKGDEEKNKEAVSVKPIDKSNPDEQKKVEIKTEEQKPQTKESQSLITKKSNPQKQKRQRSFFDNLFFSASAGPDFSSVGFHSPGEIKLAYGAGLGYKISDKFSIRTGFYSARKVYTADPEDYDPPYNVAQYYPNLKYVDANCKVYEIPVMIDYTIKNKKKGSWFVSAGVSSLIMKEEEYDYYFKPNSSPTYVTYTRTIKNKNKHYFSQLNISGGYTKNINNNISLRAEPYVKFAMHGIGFGKVNLNSSGVLFSAIIKPFAKK